MKDKSKAKRIVSADGLNIYYWTNRNKELINSFSILHPGSAMNHSSLESLEKGLTERQHPTILFDPRGVGYSDAPTQKEFYQLERYSNDLQRIIEQEGLEKPEFITHSAGFMPVVNYIAKTANANRIIGVCASPNFSETAPTKILFHLFNRGIRYIEYAGNLGMKISNILTGKTTSFPDQSNSEGKSDFYVWGTIFNVPFQGTKANTISGLEINKWNVSNQLTHVYAPVLLIYGTNDLMVRPIAGDYIKNLVKGRCHIELIRGDHSLPITKPGEVLKVIDKYSR